MRAQARHRSRLLSVLLILLAVGVIGLPGAAFGSNPPDAAPAALSPPPALGALLPITGALSLFGTDMANAIQLLDEQVNASGGIRGSNLTVYVADTQTSPVVAQDEATNLIQQHGVQAIVGPASSGETLAAFPVTQAAGVVLMSPTATTAGISAIDSNDSLWRTTASDRLQGKVAAHFSYNNLTYRRVGILAVNNAYGMAIGTSFQENFTLFGGTVSAFVSFNEFQTDYTSELTTLFASNPEAAFLIAYPYDGTTILHNWWSNHAAWPTYWIMTDAMNDQLTMDQLRSAGVDTTDFRGLNPIRSPVTTGMDAYERFRVAYAARFGSNPIILSENAYDSAYVLALAMHASGSTDPSVFRTAIRYVANPPGLIIRPGQWAEAIAALDAGQDVDYWGAANRVDFDAYGDTGTAYSVWQVNATGTIRTVAILDEPLFWTPASEGSLPITVHIQSPTAGAFLSGLVTIAGTASAAGGLVAVQVRVDTGTWENATDTSTWTFDLDTTTSTDGSHRIAARAFDGTVYSSEATVDVVVDNTAPSVTIISPAAGDYVSSNPLIVTWSSADPLSGVQTIEVRLDTQPAVVLPGSPRLSLAFSDVLDGAHTVAVRAIDRAGNARSVSVSFVADGTGPTTAFAINGTQGDAFWFTSDVHITLLFHDSGAGLGSTFIRVDENVWQTYGAPLVLTADGVYNVSFYAEDLVGNVGGHTTVRIPIDQTAPTLIINPLAALVTQSDVTITWNGSDATSGIGRYEISVDGGTFESVGRVTTKRLTLADGNHKIQVRAVDQAGHGTVASVDTRIDTNAFSFSGPYGGTPTIALPLGIAAVTAAFLWRRGRLRRPGKGSPPNAGGPRPPS